MSVYVITFNEDVDTREFVGDNERYKLWRKYMDGLKSPTVDYQRHIYALVWARLIHEITDTTALQYLWRTSMANILCLLSKYKKIANVQKIITHLKKMSYHIWQTGLITDELDELLFSCVSGFDVDTFSKCGATITFEKRTEDHKYGLGLGSTQKTFNIYYLFLKEPKFGEHDHCIRSTLQQIFQEKHKLDMFNQSAVYYSENFKKNVLKQVNEVLG